MAQLFYKFTINLTKASILLLYIRLFSHIVWFRKTVTAVLTFVLLYAVASILATVFECLPIARTWDHSIKGYCINLTAFWFANGITMIVEDFAVLVLPIKIIIDLQVPLGKKVSLFLLFGLGAL